MSESIANGLNVDFPFGFVSFNSCQIINNDISQIIRIGLAKIVCSQITGNQQPVGIEISSLADIPEQISRFPIGISLSDIQANLTINNTNLYQNTKFNLYNLSPRDISSENNCWAETNTTKIRETILIITKRSIMDK